MTFFISSGSKWWRKLLSNWNRSCMRSLFITIRLQTFLRALLQQHLQLQRHKQGVRTSVTGSSPAATVRPELLEFATSAGRVWWVMAVWVTQCVVCVNESLKRHLCIADFHFANLQHGVCFRTFSMSLINSLRSLFLWTALICIRARLILFWKKTWSLKQCERTFVFHKHY